MSRTKNGSATKNITIIPAAGGAYSDLAIAPGTTAQDIKTQLGLGSEMVLTRGKGSEAIPESENVFESVNDGAKLFATTPVEWGAL